MGGSLGPCCEQYINTLNDPFEYGGIRLGFGCLVPSELYSLHFRQTFTAASDGSFVALVLPSMGATQNNILINVSGLSGTTWLGYGYANTAVTRISVDLCRIVSCGIRVIPQVPMTAAPGVIYAGAIPATSYNAVITSSPSPLATSPFLQMGFGAAGGSAVCHPVDPASFEFTLTSRDGYVGNSDTLSSTPIIVGTGFPASASFTVEAVCNIESIRTINQYTSSKSSPGVAEDYQGPTVADETPSVERMWNLVKPFLKFSGSVDQARSTLSAMANAAHKIYHTGRAMQGKGRGEYYNTPRGTTFGKDEM